MGIFCMGIRSVSRLMVTGAVLQKEAFCFVKRMPFAAHQNETDKCQRQG